MDAGEGGGEIDKASREADGIGEKKGQRKEGMRGCAGLMGLTCPMEAAATGSSKSDTFSKTSPRGFPSSWTMSLLASAPSKGCTWSRSSCSSSM